MILWFYATVEERQTSSWSSNSLCSLGGGAAAVGRVRLGACSAETLYRGTECEMGFYCVPVRKWFSWEAMDAKTLITTLITATLFHDTAFHGKNYLLIPCHTQPLLHGELCIFYNLPTSAAGVLVPIDYKVIQLIEGSSNTQNYGY